MSKKSNLKVVGDAPDDGRSPELSGELINQYSGVALVLKSEVLDPEDGLTQADLAARCGLRIQEINEIINDKRNLTARLALGLDRGTHIPANVWMEIDADDRLTEEIQKQFKAGHDFASISADMAVKLEAITVGEFTDEDMEDVDIDEL